jgi:hypothetical protein
VRDGGVLSALRSFLIGTVAGCCGALAVAGLVYIEVRGEIDDLTSRQMRYVYDNGSLTRSRAGNSKMVVVLNGSNNAGPVSLALDMERIEAMCGDADGCMVTLGATRFRDQKVKNYILEVPLLGAPCRFFYYKQSKNWSLSQSCVATYGVYAFSDSSNTWEFSRAYQVYEYSNAYGKDNSYHDGLDIDGQPLIVMSFKGACYIAESAADPKRTDGGFLPDDPNNPTTGRGLFLVASSPTWDYSGSYPKDDDGVQRVWPGDDPERQCVAIFED